MKRPALRYHGGKWRLAPWIISHFPRHRIYVEPYGGAFSVGLRKPRSWVEVYNDLNGHIVNVFRVLRDSPDELERRVRLTPFSREEFLSVTPERVDQETDPIERARLVLLRSFMGFGSIGASLSKSTGFRDRSRRSSTCPEHDWSNYPDHIKEFSERLSGVVIENQPGIDLIKRQDGPDTLTYIDPPYVLETRTGKNYDLEMSDEDHTELALVLHECVGKVCISGYKCDLYEDLYGKWRKVKKPTRGDKASVRTEILWMNYEPDNTLFSG